MLAHASDNPIQFPRGNSYRNKRKTAQPCLKLQSTKTRDGALQNGTMVGAKRKLRERQTVRWRNNARWSGIEDSKDLLIQARSKQKSIYSWTFQKIIKN